MNVYERNMSKYSNVLQDFQQFMLNVDNKHWKKII